MLNDSPFPKQDAPDLTSVKTLYLPDPHCGSALYTIRICICILKFLFTYMLGICGLSTRTMFQPFS
jgi:hypothetical protein